MKSASASTLAINGLMHKAQNVKLVREYSATYGWPISLYSSRWSPVRSQLSHGEIIYASITAIEVIVGTLNHIPFESPEACFISSSYFLVIFSNVRTNDFLGIPLCCWSRKAWCRMLRIFPLWVAASDMAPGIYGISFPEIEKKNSLSCCTQVIFMHTTHQQQGRQVLGVDSSQQPPWCHSGPL